MAARQPARDGTMDSRCRWSAPSRTPSPAGASPRENWPGPAGISAHTVSRLERQQPPPAAPGPWPGSQAPSANSLPRSHPAWVSARTETARFRCPVRIFFTVIKGAPAARRASPAPAGSGQGRESHRENRVLTRRGSPQSWAGSGGPLALRGGSLPRPIGRKPYRARRRRRSAGPAPAGRRLGRNAPPVTAPAVSTGPSSSRRASCRRAKITIKGTPWARRCGRTP